MHRAPSGASSASSTSSACTCLLNVQLLGAPALHLLAPDWVCVDHGWHSPRLAPTRALKRLRRSLANATCLAKCPSWMGHQ